MTGNLDQYRDLVARLRSLARFEHDDHTIGDEAADLIQQLLDEIESQSDVADGWGCIPEDQPE